ncbi:MAG: crotonase/enoyl-CoA hydratase family protein [Acidobacteriota bacterium]|nr:crotonase/enoyl-CoA hydratase family protein [Acidobacteriota bacterium]
MIPEFETLLVSLEDKIAHVRLNRPAKANAMNPPMWGEIEEAFNWVDQTPEARVAVLSGEGKHFCAGIDLAAFEDIMGGNEPCEARKREALRRHLLRLQENLSSIEKCRKPVLAAMHGACIGGAIDMTSACDMRYSTADAIMCIKEVDIGMTADVGTLQRLPHLIGDGIMRELAYTGRNFSGEEARKIGFVNRTYPDKDALLAGVMETAARIAGKSPLAVRGIKEMILYTRDHSVADGLNYIATWNAAMLVSNDLQEALSAAAQKRPPEFAD